MPRRPHPTVDAFVAARISARRQALGLSQSALAQRLGISFQQVQKYEAGANRVSASRLHQIAAALGADVASFFPPGPERPTDTDPMAPAWLLSATPEGRQMAESFPLIADRDVRRALARVARALAAPA